jgi:hypothetical protein
MLLAVDFDEYLIDEEGVTVASVLPFQPPCVNGAELDTPEAYCFAAYDNASLSE